MKNTKIIDDLNKMLAQEHACAIRYATHAATVTGPYAEIVKSRLLEIASDEIKHAAKLRDRIFALGGKPLMEVSREDLKDATTLAKILEVNIAEENQAIESYTKILHEISQDNVILCQAIKDIIQDEQEHLEELQNLQG